MVDPPRMTVATLALLGALLEDPTATSYGLELSERAGLKSGTIYPLLARLERLAWLESQWEVVDPGVVGRPRRRLYQLTRTGAEGAERAMAEHLKRLAPRDRRRGLQHGLAPKGSAA